MSDDPRPDQTLPEDLDEDGNPVDPNKTPPGQDPDKERGRSAEAHERAPGQQKRDDEA